MIISGRGVLPTNKAPVTTHMDYQEPLEFLPVLIVLGLGFALSYDVLNWLGVLGALRFGMGLEPQGVGR